MQGIILERRIHIKTDETGPFENLSVAKHAITDTQLLDDAERFSHLVDRHRLWKRNHHAHSRLGSALGFAVSKLLDRFADRTSTQGDVNITCRRTGDREHQGGSVTEVAVELDRACAIGEFLA